MLTLFASTVRNVSVAHDLQEMQWVVTGKHGGGNKNVSQLSHISSALVLHGRVR